MRQFFLNVFVALSTFPRSFSYRKIGAYMPVSDVLEHSQITFDVAQFGLTLAGENPDYAGAKILYEKGNHSCKSTTNVRTLQSFAVKDLSGETFYDAASAAGLSSPQWWNEWMLDALSGTGVFEGLSTTKRVTSLKKGILGLVTLYASHELESAIFKAADVALRGNSGGGTAAHAWDEGWAFYYGADESGSNSPWEVAKKRDGDFPDGSRVHVDIVAQFNAGLMAVRNETFDIDVAKKARDTIYALWTVTYLRAALKYLEIIEHTYQEKAHAEGYAYYRAIDGWLAAKDTTAAASMRAALDIRKTDVVAGTFCDAKAKVEAAYEALGIDCAVVGLFSGSKMTCDRACSAPLAAPFPVGAASAPVVAGTEVEVSCMSPQTTTEQPEIDEADVEHLRCDWGCYDEEDELCHSGVSQSQCAEIYGHVDWAPRCSCRRDDGSIVDNVQSGGGGSTKLYFSVPAFVVLFRESLEVTILLVIMLQFLRKSLDDGTIDVTSYQAFRRDVWLGTSLGGLVALGMGAVALVLARLLYDSFQGDGELIFEGCVTLAASGILTYLAVSFYKMIHNKEARELKLRQRIEVALSKSSVDQMSKRAFFFLAFTTGLREGMESIVFLVSVVPDLKDLSSLPLPIVAALVLSRLCGFCFFKGTNNLALGRFMKGCSGLLLFIGAGLFMSGTHKFQELGVFGVWSPRSDRPWINGQVWNWSGFANDKSNRFFVLLRALFGYQDRPTPLELFAYCMFWVLAIAVCCVVVLQARQRDACGKEMSDGSDGSCEQEAHAKDEVQPSVSV
jgi:high-affinity iron transporter